MLKKFGLIQRNFGTEVIKNDIRSFDEIPGPRGIFGIGNFYNYFKWIGKYSWDEMHKSGLDRYEKYGAIVCERMVPGVSIVWIYDPNDIAQIYNDGPNNFPCRRSHLALEKYRKDRPDVYRTAGLLPTNGPEWWKLRSEVQKGLSAPQNVRNFLPHADQTTQKFIDILPKFLNDNQIIDNMLNEVERLNLELTCLLAFDEWMNSFSDDERHPESRTSKLIKSAQDTNSCILPTDQGFQLWRFFETPSYRKLRTAQEFMEDVAVDMVSKKIHNKTDGNSLLDQYLKNPNLTQRDIVGMAGDLLLAGVHTSSFTIAFALYYISKDKIIQNFMYQEAKEVLPKCDDQLTSSAMNSQIPYTRAVLKETFRLNPISIGIGRISNKDMVLSGYHVPKNTIIVTQNLISCRLEKYFADPLKFCPERWLKTDSKSNINPFLVLPFGHGMRSCIARRFAEQNILIFLLRLIRNYEIEWHGTSEPLDIVTKLINQPNCKIKLKLIKR